MPVAAFAQPLLRTTPVASPPEASRWARLTTTGAAAARFVVNVAAAGTGPCAAATSARSGAPDSLMPQAIPDASEALGRGHAHGSTGAESSPIVSGRLRATFAAWIAWPDPPLVRLSIAEIVSTVPVRSS